MKPLLRSVLSLCIALGLCLAAWPLAQTGYARWHQARLQTQWKQATNNGQQQVSKKQEAIGTAKPKLKSQKQAFKPWPDTRIVIPDIGLDAVVVQGADLPALRNGPGHYEFSALPGEVGNCVIAGHRNVYGSYFHRLDALWPGSQVILQTPQGSFSYQVIAPLTVQDNDMSVFQPIDPKVPQLTLITCTLPLSSERLIIIAQMK